MAEPSVTFIIGTDLRSSQHTYCTNFLNIGPARIQLDRQLTQNSPSPNPAAANNLFTFLAQRFVAGFGNLNCGGLTGKADPITVTTDGNEVATAATINPGNGNGNGNGTGNTVSCVVNGTAVAGCAGTTTINGQICTLSFTNNTVNITCPAANGAPATNNTGNNTGNTNTPAAGGGTTPTAGTGQ